MSTGAIEATAILRGGPHDGASRMVATDEFGNLRGYPVELVGVPSGGGIPKSGGIYWPTFELDFAGRVIYQWHEGPEPVTPPWLHDGPATWPRVARDTNGRLYFVGMTTGG